MQTGAQILRKSADHIEAHGVLFDAWESGDGTEDLPPCCCLAGTMRMIAGLPSAPPPRSSRTFDTPALNAAAEALAAQTKPERIVLGEKRQRSRR